MFGLKLNISITASVSAGGGASLPPAKKKVMENMGSKRTPIIETKKKIMDKENNGKRKLWKRVGSTRSPIIEEKGGNTYHERVLP